MSKEKHTAGKWVVSPCPGYDELHYICAIPNNVVVARTCYAIQSEANARLIAEAPTLKGYLSSARVVLARMRRSMMAHPDHEVGSEFDDLTTESQILEDEIMELIRRIEG